MSKQREALKLALEVLEEINKLSIGENAICLPAEIDTAMDAIREALAEPEQKPLTDEQIDAEFDRECWVTVVFADGTKGIALDKVTAKDFARAIERAHGIGSD